MKWTKSTAYENLRYRIIMQDISPGDSIEEKVLMKHYGIGRTPLREIFLNLQRDGFIKLVPNRGTFASSVDIRGLKHVMEILSHLEKLAVELAIDRITESQMEEIKKILLKAKELESNPDKNYEALINYESKIHDIIHEASHNPILIETLHKIQGSSLRIWQYVINGKKEIPNVFLDQNELYEAIKNKDKKKARNVIEKHMIHFLEFIKENI